MNLRGKSINLFFLLVFIIKEKIVAADEIKPKTNSTPNMVTTVKNVDVLVHDEIVNKHDFSYTMNPRYEICGDNFSYDIFLLIYVHSAPENFKRRLSIRETWARRSMFRDLRIVFMMGSTIDKKVNNLLKLENGIYNDIVQENFIDAYKNLTYKGIMAMKWISEYCKNAKLILKVDDDIITNPFIILRHLKSLKQHQVIKPKSVMCLVWVGMVVMRDKNSKWYLSKEDFKPDVFDKYCSGSAYLLTGDLPYQMYKTSFYIKFFWVDDYYITGMLAKGVNATYEFFNSLYIINSNLIEQRFLGKQSDHTAFGHIPGQLAKMYSIWDFILKNELSKFPSLHKSNAHLLVPNDFLYIKELKWNDKIWEPFLTPVNFVSKPEVEWIMELN